jgi:hypothetical protein
MSEVRTFRDRDGVLWEVHETRVGVAAGRSPEVAPMFTFYDPVTDRRGWTLSSRGLEETHVDELLELLARADFGDQQDDLTGDRPAAGRNPRPWDRVTEPWDFNRERARLDGIAQDADRRIQEIQLSKPDTTGYQHQLDEALARYYVYNSGWHAPTREAFAADLRRRREQPNEGLLSQAKDRDRAARYWTRFVDELLVYAGAGSPTS